MIALNMIRRTQYDGKALILGDDDRSFLSVVRSLGRKNICIHVGGCAPGAFALKSKYISQNHQIPHYDVSKDSWKNYLIDLIKKEESTKSEKIEITSIEALDPSEIPSETFRVPKCKKVSQKEMQDTAKDMLFGVVK